MQAAWGQTTPARLPLVPDARSAETATWRFTVEAPGEAWAGPGFVDAAWDSGKGGFGSPQIPGSIPGHPWTAPGIWMRKAFDAPDLKGDALILSLHHDDDIEVWLNGKSVYAKTGWETGYSQVFLEDSLWALLKPGRNLLAVRCLNNGGPGYVDVGLHLDATLPSRVLVDDAYGESVSQWSYTTGDPGADWAKPGFDASKWGQGRGGFGSMVWHPVGTFWTTPDIWLRTTFRVDALPAWVQFFSQHEDEMEAYLNGVLIRSKAKKTDYPEEEILATALKAMRTGTNVLAMHARKAGPGARYVDAGLIALDMPTPSRIQSGKGSVGGAVRLWRTRPNVRLDGRVY